VTALYFGGLLASQAGEDAAAVRILAAASEHDKVAAAVYPPDRAELDAALERARHALGDANYAQAWAEGRMATLEQAASIARAV
jgi:hypothetical protein